MNRIHRNYSESSSQTIEQDPDKHIQNFQLHGKPLIRTIQTDAPKETPSLLPLQTTPQDGEDAIDDDEEEGEEKELAFLLQKRLNPKKQEDFVALQSELLQWRRREERKILITCGGKERKRELTKALLIKETCLLRKIESLKNEAHSKVKSSKVEQSILKMVQPKVWQTCQGNVHVVTPETSLAREMKGIHDDVCKKIDKIPERIDLLQRVKLFLYRIHHSSTTLVKDILVLVNRELEILERDTAELGNDMLEGMRLRLQNLFTKLMFKTNALDDGFKGTKPKLLINKSLKPVIT
mmetsp:Transcript_13842/g.22678  ORF Transcript_13842/g.22678 Transcript_13842/m.22678 type:complete len:295 (+) Transcript_13842:215-1099(+)